MALLREPPFEPARPLCRQRRRMTILYGRSIWSSMKERLLSRAPDRFFVRSVAPRRGVGVFGGRGEVALAAGHKAGRSRPATGRPGRGEALTVRSGDARDHWGAKPLTVSLDAPFPVGTGARCGSFSSERVCSGGRPGSRVPVIYPPRRWWHGGFRPQPDGLNQFAGHAAVAGVMTKYELACWLRRPGLIPRRPGNGSRRRAGRSRRK